MQVTDIARSRAHPRLVAAADPGRAAIIVAETGEWQSYSELVERADRAARLFDSMGIEAGDTIGIIAENHLRYAELCWAAKNSGLYYVCASTHLDSGDLAYIIENSGMRLLLVSAAMAGQAGAALALVADPPAMMLIDESRPGVPCYEIEVMKHPALPIEGRMAGASMLYSSGTTGRPKAVRPLLGVRPPEEPPRRQQMLIDAFEFGPEMVLINPGPLYHAAPGRKMMTTLRLGGTVVIFRRFDPAAVLKAIEAYRGTHGFFVPTMFVRLLRYRRDGNPIPDHSSLSSVVHGAAPCPASIKQAMIDWWGPIIHEVYGGTEGMGHTVIRAEEWLRHKGSVGRPPTGCRMKIVDAEGRLLPQGVPGRIFMANGNRFSYLGDEAKTRAVHDEEGFATFGDIGYLDAEGYLYLTDRESHMIISGGVNIYPQEAENILIDHPAIADVAVIGIPDPEFGENVLAIVEPIGWPEDEPALARDIIAFCRARLSPIKCPRTVEFIRTLPRNEMGKVRKRDLRRQFWQGHETLIG